MGAFIVAGSILMALTAPLIVPYDPLEMQRDALRQPPSWAHPFGTDVGGRDLLSRVILGSQISLYVGFTAVALSTALGAVMGIASAYFGGKLDLGIQRLVDVMMAFPGLVMALAVMAALGQGLNNVVIAIAFATVPRFTRISRASALSAKEEQYVQAATAVGASGWRIVWVHIFRNCQAPLLVIGTAALGSAIVTEATLSYLGMGVPPPHPSWGRMVSGAQVHAEAAPWLIIFPGLALSLVVYGFNVLGDALRDVWDPRLRGR